MGSYRFGKFGLDDARRDAVDPDPVVGGLGTHHFRQAKQSCLAY